MRSAHVLVDKFFRKVVEMLYFFNDFARETTQLIIYEFCVCGAHRQCQVTQLMLIVDVVVAHRNDIVLRHGTKCKQRIGDHN